MKRVLIFGPFNDQGGREIECAYLYRILSKKYEVAVVSSEMMTDQCSLLEMHPSMDLYAKHPPGILSRLGLKTNTKPFTNTELRSFQSNKDKTTAQLIREADLVLILAQVISAHVKQVAGLARQHSKPCVFRTTGTIPKLTEVFKDGVSNLEFIRKTNLFIHHSQTNARRLSDLIPHEFKIVDQCLYNESLVGKWPVRPVRNFCFIGSLNENKNVSTIISAFKRLEQPEAQLHIFGVGPLQDSLKAMASGSNTKFHGQIPHHELIGRLDAMDCLIIASQREAGPYVGLEAMATGLPIISTPVGAMPERLGEAYEFWFDPSNSDELTERMNRMGLMSQNECASLSENLRKTYEKRYASTVIEEQYLGVIDSVINES